MSEIEEKKFEKMIPMQSVLGREFLALQANRDRERIKFESSHDKMGINTHPYRAAEIALSNFLITMIPLIEKSKESLAGAESRIEVFEDKAKEEMRIDRRSQRIIWTRFTLDRYREIAKPVKKKIRMYHPGLWVDMISAWRDFKKEIKRWEFGGMPYDGSQAMNSMIDFQIKCRLVGAAND